jgi:hypothetical protein
MKKLYTILLVLGTSSFGFTQVTLQGSDVNGVIGETFNYEQTDWISPGAAGASQTWDLSSISSTASSSLTFNAPNASFPASTVTQYDAAGSSLYMEQTNAAQIIHGMDAGGTVITYSNPQTHLGFPLSMSSSGNDTHACTFTSGGFPFDRAGSTTWEVDGWGTVITPNGTYTDVLRVKQTQTYVDTYAGGTIDYDVEIYSWMKAGIHYPLASMTNVVTSLGSNQYGTYATGPLGVDELNNFAFNLSPNPCQDIIHVSSTEGTIESVRIVDISGMETPAGVRVQTNDETIDISSLKSGVYFVTLQLSDGRQSKAQKIVKL